MESHWSLRRFYLYLNRKWFEGALPLDTIVTWEPTTDDMWAGTYYLGNGRFHIKIDPSLRRAEDYSLQLLLHEMCHIEVALETGRWGVEPTRLHGKRSKWQAKMRALAARGAFDDLW